MVKHYKEDLEKETETLEIIAGILLDALNSKDFENTTDGQVLDLIYAAMDNYTKDHTNE